MTMLEGATVLVTGAAGGFGRQMMSQFTAAGCRLIVTDREGPALTALAEQTAAAAGRPDAIRAVIAADLSSREGCEGLCREVLRTATPDVLVNNAGIGMSGRIDQIPWRKWETLMQVNLLAVMRITGLFLPRMLDRGTGHIVNIASIAGWVSTKGMSAYSASKFGVRGFSEALGRDLEETALRVTTVFPFFSRTPILESEQFGEDPPRKVPDDIVTDPAAVVGEIVRGIRDDRAQVFPDTMARRLYLLQRFFPGLVVWLGRRLEARLETAGHPD